MRWIRPSSFEARTLVNEESEVELARSHLYPTAKKRIAPNRAG